MEDTQFFELLPTKTNPISTDQEQEEFRAQVHHWNLLIDSSNMISMIFRIHKLFFWRYLNRLFGPLEMWRKRKKDLSRWLSSKLTNGTETVVGEIQNENQEREEERQKRSEEIGSEACPRFFGYLRTLPRKDPIPDECLVCMKVMECMNRHMI